MEECLDSKDHISHITLSPTTPDSNSFPHNAQPSDSLLPKQQVKREPSLVHVWPQVLASCIALSLAIQPGISFAFSSILIPQLEEDPSFASFDDHQASWLASLVAITTPLGALFSGPLMDAVGRKRACVLTNIPLILSWIIMYTTKASVWPIYTARVLAGFGGGMSTVGLVYTAEISHSSYRSMLLCLNSVFVALGIMATNVLGIALHWRSLAVLFALQGIVCLSLCLILPESPYWLTNFNPSEKRTNLALEELQKLNRPTWLYQEECRKLKEGVTVARAPSRGVRALASLAGEYFQRPVMAPFTVLLVLFLCQQLTGVYVIIFYSYNIFKAVGGGWGEFDEATGTVLLGVLRFVMSLVAAGVSRVWGRRPLLIGSSVGMAVTAVLAGALLTVSPPPGTAFLGRVNATSVDSQADPASPLSLAILLSLLVFVCAGSLGHLVLPWTLITELLPIKARAVLSGLVICFAYLLLFVTVKTFPFILNVFQIHVVLIFYGIVSLLSAVYTYFFVPETLGKTFTEIAKYFEKR